jgi:chromate transporter
MLGFALGVDALSPDEDAGWLLGLKAAAAGVVAHAVLGMAGSLATGARRAAIAVGAMAVVLLLPSALSQVAAIVVGALVGLLWLSEPAAVDDRDAAPAVVGRRTAVMSLGLFAVLLAGLPVAAQVLADPTVGLVDSFYRAGSLVFGGGHVVLPLLEAEVVGPGGVSQETFLAGYGAAQAVPGPLFTFSAYLGALMSAGPSGVAGAAIALGAIFLPSALLIVGATPFWERLRTAPRARDALAGAGAAVVGLLAAALYDPVFTEGVTSAGTMTVAALTFVALAVWRTPAWAVVLAASAVGFVLL